MDISVSLREGVTALPTGRGLDRKALARAGVLAGRRRGLISSFDVFARPGFDSSRTHPAIRAFYEESSALELEVAASWAGVLGRCYRLLSPLLRSLGQIEFPTRPGFVGIEGELVELDIPALGPECCAWFRRWEGQGRRTMYAAVHSTHAAAGETYMDFSLPMLGGVLTVTLRLDEREVGAAHTALDLTSYTRTGSEPVGTWFVRRGRSWPVPIRERITVWAAGMEGGPAPLSSTRGGESAWARHQFFMCGRRFLVLHYRITAPGSTDAG